MPRAGVATFVNSADHPVRQDSYWRTVIDREQRDHPFSPFNDPCPRASHAYLSTTSNDFQSRTWQVLHQTCNVAAGKSTFHNNVARPSGWMGASTAASSLGENTIRGIPIERTAVGGIPPLPRRRPMGANTASSSFERTAVGGLPPIPRGAAAAFTGSIVLQGSASTPDLAAAIGPNKVDLRSLSRSRGGSRTSGSGRLSTGRLSTGRSRSGRLSESDFRRRS